MNQSLSQAVEQTFGHKLRTRVCGILIENGKVLVLKHLSVGDQHLWAPPGGGLHYAEDTHTALVREFAEETGLQVAVKRFMCTHEFLRPPLHAIELFFEVERTGGALHLGSDPEMQPGQQLISQIAWLSVEELRAKPAPTVHNLFAYCNNTRELQNLNGLYRFL